MYEISKIVSNIWSLPSFYFDWISVFTEVFWAMFQLPRKAKEAFHDHLTQFKFEELIDVKEIGMFIFMFCSQVFLYGCLCNQRNVQSPASRVQRPESSVQSPASRLQHPTLVSRVQEFRYALHETIFTKFQNPFMCIYWEKQR